MSNINKIKVSGQTYNIQDQNATKTLELTQAEYDALAVKDPNTFYIITDSEGFDLSNYYTKSETSGATQISTALVSKADKSEIPSLDGYATETWVEGKGYLTEHQDISGKLDVSAFNTYSGSVNTQLNSKASESDLNALNDTVTAHTANASIHVTAADKAAWNAKSDFSGSYNDLTDKPTIPTVPTSNTAFTNDAGYITSDAISGKADTSAVTESINAAVSGKVDTSTFNTYSGSVDTALNAKADTATTYTKTEVDTALGGKVNTSTYNTYTAATDTAIAGKQATLVSGTNIKTINNESLLGSGNIEIQGGGKAVSAGTNISITTGETADTISCTLPISADNSSITINRRNIRFGNSTTSNFNRVQFAFGDNCSASGIYSMAMGANTQASNYCTFAYGYRAVADNQYQTSFGRNPLSSVGSSTFGDSGNTLFCVGNALADTDSSRHNAFEIRQNGDIYCSDGTNDVKLQDTITATAANTTALGGLKLVKLSQSEYDSLATKDNSTLYVIVN